MNSLSDTLEKAKLFSPYFQTLLEKEDRWISENLTDKASLTGDQLYSETKTEMETAFKQLSSSTSLDEIMKLIRLYKRRFTLLIGLFDFSKQWTVKHATATYTDFSETLVRLCLEFLFKRAFHQNKLKTAEFSYCGLFILAMGKMGSKELNYSSDIDLIVFFDPDRFCIQDSDHLPQAFIRIIQDLVRILSERTIDGYGFRTDLRLRPDPSSTRVAMSVIAAEHYYESRGRNWERAAFIKARTIAGDFEAGQRFLKYMQPFVWRKNLDFSMIEDLHSMRSYIQNYSNNEDLSVLGHDIKLGFGGIREIEFFVQMRQLMAGGRDPDLRIMQTTEGLKILVEKDWISAETQKDLEESYWFLRDLEHHLQLIHDEQTHTIPEKEALLKPIWQWMDFKSLDDFSQTVQFHLKRVRFHTENTPFTRQNTALPPLKKFNDSVLPSLSLRTFFDRELRDDVDKKPFLHALHIMGFLNPEQALNILRGWYTGGLPAFKSEKSHQLLEDIQDILLTKISKTPNPHDTLLNFDELMGKITAGISFLSMIKAYPNVLDLILKVTGYAPVLAHQLALFPSILDTIFETGFVSPPLQKDVLNDSLNNLLNRSHSFEESLNLCRKWVKEHHFRLGISLLENHLSSEELSLGYTHVAEAVVHQLYQVVWKEIQEKYELNSLQFPFAIIGMGSFGAKEMTYSSDLDLMFIYDDSSFSPELKELNIPQRFGKRLLTALTASTEEGQLYNVDMRLRPSGNSGPLMTRLDSFQNYQQHDAWVWEKLSLVRGRIIYADPCFNQYVQSSLDNALIHHHFTADDITKSIQDMRDKLLKERPAGGLWDVKLQEGGLFDLYFILQGLTLIYAKQYPEILNSSTLYLMNNLKQHHIIKEEDYVNLKQAFIVYHKILHVHSLYGSSDMTFQSFPETFTSFFEMTITTLEELYKHQLQAVKTVFDTVFFHSVT